MAVQFLKHHDVSFMLQNRRFTLIEKQIRLTFCADGENWPLLAKQLLGLPAVAVPMSSTSIADGFTMGLGIFDVFVCTQGKILVHCTARPPTAYIGEEEGDDDGGSSMDIGKQTFGASAFYCN